MSGAAYAKLGHKNMPQVRVRVPAIATLALALTTAPLAAQPVASLGTRALGMGGAFVAVADDTTAVYWNPAGLAKGPFFGAVFEGLQDELDPTGHLGVSEASERAATLAAVGVPSLALSYARLRATRVPAPGARLTDTGSGAAAVSSLTTHHVGATILQSLGEAVVVGTTLRWVRGVAAAGPDSPGAGTGERLAAARDRPGRSAHAFDLDVGLLAVFGRVRAGLVGRNLRAPEFAAPDGSMLGLEKQVRAGVAVQVVDRVLVAADADLRRTTDLDGIRRRRAAVGAEGRVAGWLTLRAGLGLAVSGGARASASGGASVALGRFWLDGRLTRGAAGERGWGLGFRLDY